MRTLIASEVQQISGGVFARDLVNSVGWADGLMAGSAASMAITDAIEGAGLLSEFGPAGMLIGAAGGALVGTFVNDAYSNIP
jgi:hypothetical protein